MARILTLEIRIFGIKRYGLGSVKRKKNIFREVNVSANAIF